MTRSFPLFSLRIFVSTESTLPREVPGGDIQGPDSVPWARTVACVAPAPVPGSVLGSCSRCRGRRENGRGGAVTWPKPPWGPRRAGPRAPAPAQLAPLQGHASGPPPLRRQIRRTTRRSCTGNLEEQKPHESRGQRSSSRHHVGTIKKPFHDLAPVPVICFPSHNLTESKSC